MWFEAYDAQAGGAEVLEFFLLFLCEEDLLAAELVGFFDVGFLDGACAVVGEVGCFACGDLRGLAVEVDVAAPCGLLALQDVVALDGDGEAGADLEGEVGEERALGGLFGVDV